MTPAEARATLHAYADTAGPEVVVLVAWVAECLPSVRAIIGCCRSFTLRGRGLRSNYDLPPEARAVRSLLALVREVGPVVGVAVPPAGSVPGGGA